ncbi:MAG: polysaccharide biosynthesis C-terminal domain-containing protein, partial [Clostridia bacterium]|nr:polysaccharide biosynthesis C-terminal domain-containing protein [Clostridia bacterium]
FAVTQLLIYMLRSVETVRIGLITSVITLVINVCLNYIFIFGNFGMPRMGAQGAAVATLISRGIELTVVVVYVFFIDKKVKLRLKHFGRVDGELFRAYVRKGTPVFLSGTMWGFAQGVQTSILGHTAGPTIKANSISAVVFQMVSVVSYASASATSVVIGKTIGEGRREMVKPYIKTLQVLFLIIGVFTGAVLFLLRGPIINFYDISEEAKTVASQFMAVLAVTVIGTSYQMPCHTGIVRAGGDTSFVLKVDAVFMWLVVIPAAAIASFVFHASPLIVFICLKCDQILKCFVAVIKVNSFNYIRSLKPDDKKEITEGK